MNVIVILNQLTGISIATIDFTDTAVGEDSERISSDEDESASDIKLTFGTVKHDGYDEYIQID